MKAKIEVVSQTVKPGARVELACTLRNSDGRDVLANAQQKHVVSWMRYPNGENSETDELPATSRVHQNRLIIDKFDNAHDNGLYACRISSSSSTKSPQAKLEHRTLRLIGSNDFLVSPSNGVFTLFSEWKYSDESKDVVVVECRPGTFAEYEWVEPNKGGHNVGYKIEERGLRVSDTLFDNTSQQHVVTCWLKRDSKLGANTPLELHLTRELFEAAINNSLN